jgi:uncharacterized protein YecT (DUF1311 family)
MLFVLIQPLSLGAAPDPCASTTKDPIDVAQEKDIAKDSSTAGIRAASNAAREKWDAEMNGSYKRLMAKLDPERRAALQKAQRAWLAFRDAEGESITSVVATQQGTMYQMIATDRGAELVKDRALQLRAYEWVLQEL